MTLQIDDLRVGQWVVARDYKDQTPDLPFPMVRMPTQPKYPDGTPNKIVAICLPYIITWQGAHFGRIDVRYVSLQRASESYVNAWLKAIEGTKFPLSPSQMEAYKQAEANVQVGLCPRCGTPLEMTPIDDGPLCNIYCPKCNISSERVESV